MEILAPHFIVLRLMVAAISSGIYQNQNVNIPHNNHLNTVNVICEKLFSIEQEEKDDIEIIQYNENNHSEVMGYFDNDIVEEFSRSRKFKITNILNYFIQSIEKNKDAFDEINHCFTQNNCKKYLLSLALEKYIAKVIAQYKDIPLQHLVYPTTISDSSSNDDDSNESSDDQDNFLGKSPEDWLGTSFYGKIDKFTHDSFQFDIKEKTQQEGVIDEGGRKHYYYVSLFQKSITEEIYIENKNISIQIIDKNKDWFEVQDYILVFDDGNNYIDDNAFMPDEIEKYAKNYLFENDNCNALSIVYFQLDKKGHDKNVIKTFLREHIFTHSVHIPLLVGIGSGIDIIGWLTGPYGPIVDYSIDTVVTGNGENIEDLIYHEDYILKCKEFFNFITRYNVIGCDVISNIKNNRLFNSRKIKNCYKTKKETPIHILNIDVQEVVNTGQEKKLHDDVEVKPINTNYFNKLLFQNLSSLIFYFRKKNGGFTDLRAVIELNSNKEYTNNYSIDRMSVMNRNYCSFNYERQLFENDMNVLQAYLKATLQQYRSEKTVKKIPQISNTDYQNQTIRFAKEQWEQVSNPLKEVGGSFLGGVNKIKRFFN